MSRLANEFSPYNPAVVTTKSRGIEREDTNK